MRLLVCGGRYYGTKYVGNTLRPEWERERDHVTAVLDNLRPSLIVEGGASGADAVAHRYAESRGVGLVTVPALWRSQGRSAGFKRNTLMAWVASSLGVELCVAFPGNAGTADMVERAAKARIQVIRPTLSQATDSLPESCE